MEILQSYEFKKQSSSRYAPVVKALVDQGAFAVKLKRGEDFDQAASIETVQGGVSTLIRKAGHRARTFRESDDVLVVTLYAEGEGPKPRRRARQRVAA